MTQRRLSKARERLRDHESDNLLQQAAYTYRLQRRQLRSQQSFRLTPRRILHIHKLLVQNIEPEAGRYRDGDVDITNTDHVPPPFQTVPSLMTEMCDYVNDNWRFASSLHLAAYVMWRINWIHPFFDGNGRTSRAVASLVMSLHMGMVLPGMKTLTEQIQADRYDYYEALAVADRQFARGRISVTRLEKLLGKMLTTQLMSVRNIAQRQRRTSLRRRTRNTPRR